MRYVCIYVRTTTLRRKDTKKKSNMQIYEQKNAEFVDFARKLACFGVIEGVSCRKFRHVRTAEKAR